MNSKTQIFFSILFISISVSFANLHSKDHQCSCVCSKTRYGISNNKISSGSKTRYSISNNKISSGASISSHISKKYEVQGANPPPVGNPPPTPTTNMPGGSTMTKKSSASFEFTASSSKGASSSGQSQSEKSISTNNGASGSGQMAAGGSISGAQQAGSDKSSGNAIEVKGSSSGQQTASGGSSSGAQTSMGGSSTDKQTVSGGSSSDKKKASGRSSSDKKKASGRSSSDKKKVSGGSSSDKKKVSGGSSSGAQTGGGGSSSVNQSGGGGSSSVNQSGGGGSSSGVQIGGGGSSSGAQTGGGGSSSVNQNGGGGSSSGNQSGGGGSSTGSQSGGGGSSSGNQSGGGGSSSGKQSGGGGSSSGNQSGGGGSSSGNQSGGGGSSSGAQTGTIGLSSGTQSGGGGSSSSGGTSSATQTTSGKTTTTIEFKGSFSKVFAFGDSYTDTGNALLAGGMQQFANNMFSHTGGNSPAGGRLCDGRLVVDFLCDTLKLPSLPPVQNSTCDISAGVNFAIAGATSLTQDALNANKFVQNLLFKDSPHGFQTQIDWFTKFLDQKECVSMNPEQCKEKLQNALFWVGGLGGDDYSRVAKLPFSIPAITEMCVNTHAALLKTMLDRGAKYIVVQGLPPVGCCPISLFFAQLHDRDDMQCSSGANKLITTHNDLLMKKLDELRLQHPDCMIIYADYFAAYTEVLKNYQQYQFAEPFKTCCGGGKGPLNFDIFNLCGKAGSSTCQDPAKFISWDGIHCTEAMNKVVADLFFNKGYCKPSFQELLQRKQGMV